MNRRAFLSALGGTLLAAPIVAGAQGAPRVSRVGYLALNLTAGDPSPREALLQALRGLGYVEGKNLIIENRDARGKPDRFPALAAELAALNVDLILAGGGTLGAMAAKQATATIPVVFLAVGDPVTEGLVDSFARPGGNVTGLAVNSPELASKSLELLKQMIPGLTRVAMLNKPDATLSAVMVERVKTWDAAARDLGMRLQVVEARGPEDFNRAFSAMVRERADALTVVATPVFDNQRRRIAELAARHRLPAVYTFRPYVDSGGLMSYGPDISDLFRRAATYVDKILKGARPGDLPMERPTRFDFLVNLRTAQALGLTIPPSVLHQATETIQ
ncbi:MAG TPA: ABC transporter substrate-binding protein [Methylomirabilota bacterium]